MMEAASRFLKDETPVSFAQIGTGHIHKTYRVTTDRGNAYILQRLNRYVFPNLDAVMGNAARLAAYLTERGTEAPLIRYLPARDGGLLYEDGAGAAWRCYRFVPHSVCLQSPSSVEQCRETARAFGRFAEALRDFPAEQLEETIPAFHHTPRRYRAFHATLAADPYGRRAEVENEIRFLLEREAQAGCLVQMLEQGELPLRVTHNDAKCSNVLLDSRTGNALSVIDLDTVMPGLAAYDFGDLVRSCASTKAEDEQSGSGIGLDLSRYRALLDGFREAYRSLTEAERRSLPLGAYTMTLECALRFLTDYLDGDRYFATEWPRHNLDRARNQMGLLRAMEQNWDEMIRED